MYTQQTKQIAKKILSLKNGRYVQCFLKKEPEETQLIYNITKFLLKSVGLTERCYCIQNEIIIQPKCKTCDSTILCFVNKHIGYRTYCSIKCSASNLETREKCKQTNLKTLGVENPFQSNKIKEKIKQTMIKNHGVEYPAQSRVIKEKQNHIMMQRHGVEHALQSNIIKEKQKQNCLKRHGVERVNQRHNPIAFNQLSDPNWLYNQHTTLKKTMIQIAQEQGVDITTIRNYLYKHDIELQTHAGSFKEIKYLDSIMNQQDIFIQHGKNGRQYKIPGTNLRVDGFCEKTNTVYEFHGDFWHGNPERYKSAFYNNACYKTMGELHQNTLKKEKKIKELGYNLVVMWETDWDKICYNNAVINYNQ